MAKDLDIELKVKFNDQASQGLKKLADSAEKVGKQAEERAKKRAKTETDSAKQSAQSIQNTEKETDNIRLTLNRKAEQYARRLAQAKSQLGMRTEHEIQREIKRTEIAYQRLARSGKASAQDLARAQEKMTTKIKSLNAEMGKSVQMQASFGSRISNIGRGVMGISAGVGVGINLASKPIKSTADYNLQLAYLANTAFSDQDLAGRKAGMDKIHNTIKTSLQYGGTKETAIEALSSMISKGRVSVDGALSLLPVVQKNAIATNASTVDIAELVNAGLGYGIKEDQIQEFIDYANAAGKAGGFELKDMAQYAPALFAKANQAGLSGMAGAKDMFKMLQQIYNVSGGSSETANNLMNFLTKLNSQDTINRAAKIDYIDPKTKKNVGLDLPKSMQNFMKKGQTPVEAFLSIIDNVLGNDKEYQKLNRLLKNTKDQSERKALLERIAKYVEGTKIGELIGDQQAMMGLIGIRSQKETSENVDEAYKTALGGTEKDAALIESQATIKFQKAENAYQMTQFENFKEVTNWTADVAQKMTDYGAQYPALTSALVGAADSIKILGGAAATAAGSLVLMGGLGGLKGGLKSILTGKSAQTVLSEGMSKGVTSASRFNLLSGAGGWFTKGALGIGLMVHSEELNRGEDESLDFNKRLATGNATVDELAQNDTAGAKNLDEVAQRRQQREAMYAQKGIKPLDGQELEQYNLLVDRYFKQVLQTRYDKAVETLNSHWFTSAGEKEKAMDYLNSLNSQDLTTEQATQVASLRKGYISDRRDQAQGTLASMWSSDEEKQKARAYLDETSPKALRYSQGYQGMANANLGKPSLLHTQETQSDRVGFDLTPLVSSQERTFDDFQMSLSSDIAQFGQQISEGLMSAIQAQEQKIENVIRVELDGRLLSEQVSEYQYQAFKRG